MTSIFKTGSLFCFGLGYVAQHLFATLNQEGIRTQGTHRIGPLGFDGNSRNSQLIPAIQEASHILISIPPNDDGDQVLAHYADVLREATPSWIGYLSSTSIYGDHQGAWVDETSHCHPTSPNGKARLIAEQQWIESFHSVGLPIHIFRLSGIYGLGRSVFDTLKNGTAQNIIKQNHVFSRIHVDDIVKTLLTSIENPMPGEIYNVSDDLPASSSDVLSYACQISGLPCPEPVAFEKAILSPMGKGFYKDHKRVSNHKVKEKLGLTLAYPSYREGLQSILTSKLALKADSFK